ncbi:hypothetical protein [Variovorax paradoxus]|uniref:hypothetical protein n=1 Tax=Variovorax paradoxus TaxID=34073 RepID=UPI003D660B8D
MIDEEKFKEAARFDQLGRHADAARLYASLSTNSTDARLFMAFGRCLQSLGHWGESIVQLQRAIDLRPAYCEGDTRLALATALMRTGQKAQAIKQWKIVAEMPPEYPSYGAVADEARAALAGLRTASATS